MRRALAAAVVAMVVLAGCGGDDSTDPDDAAGQDTASATATAGEPTGEPSTPSDTDDDSEPDDRGTAIEIEVEGDEISPNGKRVEVERGQPVILEVESDRAGSLHVHSSPEQELEFGRGESVLELTIDTPGVVDVEEHEAGVVILQLEVS